MTRYPLATDDKDSNLDPNRSGPSPETTCLGDSEWSTSRRELWCFYLYYVVRFLGLFFGVVSCPIDQRATIGCPDSTLAVPNSIISSTSLAMTRASRRSANHVSAALIACCRIWDTSAIVHLTFAFFIGHAGVADEFTTFLSAMRSQLNCSPYERGQLCYPGSLVANDRRLGRLGNVEVRRGGTFQGG